MARKREEKANQNASNNAQKSRQENNSPGKDKNFHSLKQQLISMKLTLREIPGDGNCLFGALADQLDGTPKTHHKHRQDVVSYMRNHREDFEPFVEDDIPFERHLSNLAELGTYGGNECIVAFARLNKVKVVIHQLNAPLWQIDGSEGKENIRELHISYHNGDHYNSVRRTGDYTANPTNIKLMTVKDSCCSESEHKKENSKVCDKGENYTFCYEDLDHTYNPCYNDNVDGMVASSDEYQELYCSIMNQTGCDNMEIVKNSFMENHGDVGETIESLDSYLIQRELKDDKPNSISPLWGPNGTGTRIFGPPDCVDAETELQAIGRKSKRCTKNSKEKLQEKLQYSHLSNSKRKELKKQLRKQQGIDRKRHPRNHEDECLENSDDSGETIIVKEFGCLSI